MAAGLERYPSGPLERFPSDRLMSVDSDDVLRMDPLMEALFREFSTSTSQRDMPVDALYRNDSINPDISQALAPGFPEGGSYIISTDAKIVGHGGVDEVVMSTVTVAEMVQEGGAGGSMMQLDNDDLPNNDADHATNIGDYDAPGESGDLSATHFAGTNSVMEADTMLDTLVSDTISGVPTPERSHKVIGLLEKAGIVPSIVDRFTPTTSVRVVYNDNLELQNGMQVAASEMFKPPIIEIEGAFVSPGSLYTVLLIANGDRSGERLHWLHVNYQGPQSIASAVARAGADIVHYEAPKTGDTSNWAFVLFRQTKPIIAPVAHADDTVSTRSFSAQHHLIPVGALCFTTSA